MSNKSSGAGRMVLFGVILLILSVVVVSWLLETTQMGAGWRLALIAVPVGAWVLSLVGYYGLIQHLDELQKRIHLEALAFAFSGLAVAIIACEYLRKAGFISLLKPDHVLLMMVVLWPIGFVIAWRRYQ